MSMEENKAIVRRFLEALDQQNFDALKEHPGLYQTVVRQPLIRAAFPDLQTTIEHQVAEREIGERILFAAFDDRLNSAARAEGLTLIDLS